MIDTKRLATDAAYWRECGAPEDATYFDTESEFFFDEGGSWSGAYYRVSHNLPKVYPRFIPRPQYPEAEWADGLPPLGTECEVVDDGSLVYGQGESGECIAHVENTAVIRMSYGLGCFEARFLKPSRTKAQRDRDELKSLLEDNIRGIFCCEDGKVRADVEEQVNAILSCYNLEPKS